MKNFNFYKSIFLIITLLILVTLEVLAYYTKQLFIFYILIALTIFIILNALPQISKSIESALQYPFNKVMRHFRRINTRKSHAIYNGIALVHFVCATILLLIMSWLIKKDDFYSSIVIAPFVAVFMERGFSSLWSSMKAISQEGMKKSLDDDYLNKYYYDHNYDKSVPLANGNYSFLYEPKLIYTDQTIVIDDYKDKWFATDGFCEENFDKLMSLHSASYIPNSTTIRLDDLFVNSEIVHLYTSRSTFYNDLVSNRIMDYKIDFNYSLRDVYEYGPTLTPLNRSALSNHIGINALVFLKDGYFLMPVRDESSTMSKNQATSSLAFKAAAVDNFTVENLKHGQIVKELLDKLYITFVKDVDTITFLGCGRNVYDGGKPQFYYYVNINSMTSEQYRAHLLSLKEKQKENTTSTRLDKNKKIFLADLDSLKLGKHKTTIIDVFIPKNKKIIKKEKTIEFEKSFFANLYHYKNIGKEIKEDQSDYILK